MVANGDLRLDAVDCYRLNLERWFTLCRVKRVDAGIPSKQNLEGYRAKLIAAGLRATTVAVKLTVMRRFCQSATDRGLINRLVVSTSTER